MQRCYQGNVYIFPNVTGSGDMISGLSTGMVHLWPIAGASGGRDSEEISVSSFLQTSGRRVCRIRGSWNTKDTLNQASSSLYYTGRERRVLKSLLEAWPYLDQFDHRWNHHASLYNLEINLIYGTITSAIGDVDNLSDARNVGQYNTKYSAELYQRGSISSFNYRRADHRFCIGWSAGKHRRGDQYWQKKNDHRSFPGAGGAACRIVRRSESITAGAISEMEEHPRVGNRGIWMRRILKN